MINASGQAEVYDYGLESFVDDISRQQTQMRTPPWDWMAPEIVARPGGPHEGNQYAPYTKETDIYAFAILMIEVCSIVCLQVGLDNDALPRFTPRYSLSALPTERTSGVGHTMTPL
jgi:serine/threonine protein kinase